MGNVHSDETGVSSSTNKMSEREKSFNNRSKIRRDISIISSIFSSGVIMLNRRFLLKEVAIRTAAFW